MSVSHRITFILVFSLIAGISGTALAQVPGAASATAIFGRWEGLPTSTVGIGHVMEFTSSGIAVCTPGSLVEGAYRVNGNNMIQTSAAPPETVTVRIEFKRDTMIQYSANHLDSIRLVRRSGTESNTAVGVWRSKSASGRESFVEYRADGTFKLWVPFDSENGTYRIASDTMIIAVEKGKLNGKYLWSMEGAKLKLIPVEGEKSPAIMLSRSGG
jgi:hypothetical protein